MPDKIVLYPTIFRSDLCLHNRVYKFLELVLSEAKSIYPQVLRYRCISVPKKRLILGFRSPPYGGIYQLVKTHNRGENDVFLKKLGRVVK
ncbi:hypothetical protein [Microscilla marina]|uniref:Uncharacterized protein n=1 Tax=Microscilla marina ATCC 23134 TaxID=313606 RepID=A1ZJ90_MICM2|nr:hypothetical protein [Microscilla marina]EAY29626.1 hypothetical protein M23134_00510 [Microscilla marina ATCC 23134]